MKRALALVGAGFLTSVLALTVAAWIVAPAIRAVFGPPVDYNTDYTSRSAMAQCWGAQAGALVVGYLLLGTWAGRGAHALTWREALCAANPATVGLAFLVYRTAFSLPLFRQSLVYEFTSPGTGVMHALAASALFAPMAWAGARALRRR